MYPHYRVLYVDDEPDLLEIAKIYLEESQKFIVDTQCSARDGLDCLKQRHYDAIISDYLMPDMDGIAFLKEVRSHYPDLPFVLFTGKGREEVIIQAIDSGVDFYLQKGGDPQAQFAELAHKIRQAVQRRRAEVSLKESEVKYRTLIDSANEAVLVIKNGRICFANAQAEKITGIKRTEAATRSFLDFIHPDDREMVAKEHRKRLGGESLKEHYTFRIFSRTGSILWMEISASLTTWEGEPAVIVFLSNITERKQAEEALFSSQQMLLGVIDTIPERVFWKDRNSVYLGCNKSLAHDTGYKEPSDLAGKTDYDLSSPASAELFRADDRQVMESGQPKINYEEVRIKPDGSRAWLRTSKVPIRDKEGTVIGVLGTYEDITDWKQREEALRQANLVVENSPVILFRWKAAEGWPVAYVSENVSQFGYSPEELVSGAVPYSAIVHPDDLARVTYEVGKYCADGVDKFRQEYRIITKDDKVRWIEDRTNVWRDEQGTVTHFEGIVIDITEQRRINDEIELLKISVDQAPDELFWLDFEGNILNMNDAACRMTGYSRQELLKMKIFEIDPDFSLEIWDRVTADIRKRKTLVFTARQRGKDGVIIDIEIMAVYVEKDNRDYMFTFVRDITQRQQTENALRESDKRYRLIMQSANDAIFIHEIGEKSPGRFIEVNDQACQMLGYTREELLQMSIPDIDVPEMKDRSPGVIRELTRTGSAVFQTEVLTKDGRRIPADVRNRLVELDGRPVVLSIIHDISDLKKSELALQATNRKLSLLSSITRHDIINQLTLLAGYIRISHGYLDDKKALIKFLEKADKAVTTIEHHIRFTREYEEMGVHAPAWQNVHDIIIKAMVGLPTGDTRIDVDRADLDIFADPLCGRVFYNLIDNALRYGGEGMKTIRFLSQESDTGLSIICEDDGVGIADDVKNRLFTRGFGKNTGLGLFLSREILSITGITITENGTPGKGARFGIAVPKGMYRFSGPETKREK